MKKTKKKILAIRFSAMGDVAMTVPVIKAVTEQNPNTEIIMVSKEFFAPLFDEIPQVKFIGVNLNKYKGISGLYKLFLNLKKNQPSEIADLHNVIRSKILSSFFRLFGYKVYTLNKGRKEKKALTRTKNKIFKPLKSTHERYADVFRKMNLNVDLEKTSPLPPPPLSPQVKIFLDTLQGEKMLGIAPFAAHTGKQYPLNLMQELIKKILEKKSDVVILLFGGGNIEKKMLNDLEKIDRNRVVNLTGIFSFKEELQIISRLHKMISMDSGNGHLAALYNIPVHTIWGATHPYAGFVPFKQPSQNQLVPDIKKFNQLPTSIYGNKTFPKFEQIWETIPPEKIINSLFE